MTEIPETLKGYQTIAESANRQGVLDQKTQELISLAVAVTTRCDGCISIHSQAALKAGASRRRNRRCAGRGCFPERERRSSLFITCDGSHKSVKHI